MKLVYFIVFYLLSSMNLYAQMSIDEINYKLETQAYFNLGFDYHMKNITLPWRKYTTEEELRKQLAIRDDWGVQIEYVTEFNVPSGTWLSEGNAASQGVGYQAVITNTPNAWIIRTDKAFK